MRIAWMIALLGAGVALPGTLAPLSPAERAVAEAREAIAKSPGSAAAHAGLAMALARRARETGDPKFYDQGEAAVAKSLDLDPGSFDAQRARVWLLLGKHDFAKALELARSLNTKVPDDVMLYGFIADAAVELGRYEEAEKAAQWMLDLRPGNIPGLTRGAYLRELFGDVEGAIDFMRQALARTRPEESEDRAWLLTHIGHLQLSKGEIGAAERSLEQALLAFPDYHYALANMAKVRLAQKRPADAATLYRKRYQIAPHPENLFDVGVALYAGGQRAESERAFADFERSARAEMDGPDNSNRELIFYYLDYAKRPAEALRIAEREITLKQDVFTLDAYAWALFGSGRYKEAQAHIGKALRMGIKDAKMLYHAGMIAAKLQDKKIAAAHFERSLAANPVSEVAEKVRRRPQAVPSRSSSWVAGRP